MNLEAINKEMVERWKDVKVDKGYDIPYLAGYSKDGSTVYIDRHIPKEILKKYEFSLKVHELSEWIGIHKYGLNYQNSHTYVATVLEKYYTEKRRYNWKKYNEELKPYIKGCDKEKVKKVPLDLDLTPYEDEHDKRVMSEIVNAQKKEIKK